MQTPAGEPGRSAIEVLGEQLRLQSPTVDRGWWLASRVDGVVTKEERARETNQERLVL